MWGSANSEKFKDWCEHELGKTHMEKLRFKYYARGAKVTKSERELLRQHFVKLTAEIKGKLMDNFTPDSSK